MTQEKIAVVLYGPPGGGKGTQANLLADAYGLVHFDTGRYLESIWHDPKRQKEKRVRVERKKFDSGELNSPSFVFHEVRKEAEKLARAGWGVVFSGSPRTFYEAENLVPVLKKLYTKEKLFFVRLDVDERHSVERNSARLMCTVCHAPLLTKYYPSKKPTHCPVCGGPFYRRSLDDPRVIKERLREYRERTEPIFSYITKQGYRIAVVDGRPEPYKVFQSIRRVIDRRLK